MVVPINIKTIPYGMYMSYLIRKTGYNVGVNPSLRQSKYTFFDKHTFGHMQYVMDAHNNYVKKSGRALKQSKLERQSKEALAAPRHQLKVY